MRIRCILRKTWQTESLKTPSWNPGNASESHGGLEIIRRPLGKPSRWTASWEAVEAEGWQCTLGHVRKIPAWTFHRLEIVATVCRRIKHVDKNVYNIDMSEGSFGSYRHHRYVLSCLVPNSHALSPAMALWHGLCSLLWGFGLTESFNMFQPAARQKNPSPGFTPTPWSWLAAGIPGVRLERRGSRELGQSLKPSLGQSIKCVCV